MNYLLVGCLILSLFAGGDSLSLVGEKVTGVIGTQDNKAYITCRIIGELPQDLPTYKIWMDPSGSTIAFNEEVVNANLKPRVTYIETEDPKEMKLRITKLQLSDAGNYRCEIAGLPEKLTSTSNLTVNQYPTVAVNTLPGPTEEGTPHTFATCIASNSKPAPSMWFTDDRGQMVTSSSEVQVTTAANGLTESSLNLTRSFARQDHDKVYTCVVQHQDRANAFRVDTEPINVQYPPSVFFEKNTLAGTMRTFEEGESFSALCYSHGNPAPDVNWSFTADVVGASESESANATHVASTIDVNAMPKNFKVENGRLTADSLEVPGLDVTNNGTFTCTASNGIGDPVSISFQIGVYVIPTTPQPPTTEATQPGGESDGFPAPSTTAPPTVNAAVIGGVVAVAVFVLIVTIIVLVRYFMAHKGEYYTNELKASHDVEEASNSDDDDDLPSTEADLLGEKKRTEHFL